jgi:hypothetical protein
MEGVDGTEIQIQEKVIQQGQNIALSTREGSPI